MNGAGRPVRDLSGQPGSFVLLAADGAEKSTGRRLVVRNGHARPRQVRPSPGRWR